MRSVRAKTPVKPGDFGEMAHASRRSNTAARLARLILGSQFRRASKKLRGWSFLAPRMLPTRVNTLGENSPSLHGTAAQITRSSRCIPGFEAYSARSTPSSRSCRRRRRVNFFRRSLGMNRTGILGAQKAAGPGTHLLPQTFSSPRREAAVERRISR